MSKKPLLTLRSLTVYPNDVKLNWTQPIPPREDASNKSEITEFSERSRRRLAFVASNTDVRFKSIITLTYPNDFSNDGAEIKRHLKVFLKRLKRRYKNVEYLWFIEFQRRGAPHYHIITTARPKHDCRQWLSQSWYDIVGSNDPKHLKAGTQFAVLRKSRGGAHYAVKYAMKMRQKRVPPPYRNVGRFWGHSPAVKPKPIAPDIPIEDIETLWKLLSGWEYLERLDKPVGTLYNASKLLVSNWSLDRHF